MSVPSGLLNLNKPQGMTSRDVVNRVVRVLREITGVRRPKAGHCGTLDPMATGVLVVCTGRATRLVSRVQDQRKLYEGRFRLGVMTNTDDVTGDVIRQTDVRPSNSLENEIRERLPGFVGEIQQTPPQYSAVHVNGRRAYKLARKGAEVEIEPRPVTVYGLELTAFEFPEFKLRIECGSGTYIRSIGRDLGQELGCGATMTRLCRKRVGTFSIEQALEVDALSVKSFSEKLQPPAVAVSALPQVRLSEAQQRLIGNGRAIEADACWIAEDAAEPGSELALIATDGQLAAIAELDAASRVVPRTVFRTADAGPPP